MRDKTDICRGYSLSSHWCLPIISLYRLPCPSLGGWKLLQFKKQKQKKIHAHAQKGSPLHHSTVVTSCASLSVRGGWVVWFTRSLRWKNCVLSVLKSTSRTSLHSFCLDFFSSFFLLEEKVFARLCKVLLNVLDAFWQLAISLTAPSWFLQVVFLLNPHLFYSRFIFFFFNMKKAFFILSHFLVWWRVH